MEATPTPASPLWPFLVYCAGALTVVAGMVGLSYVLGQRHGERATGEPYESGVPPTGSARVRVPARFYLVAMFFVVFDLESVFLFAWAVSAREVGWMGYAEVVVFAVILAAALVYLWRSGGLDWRPPASQRRKRPLPAGEMAEKGGVRDAVDNVEAR